MNRKLVPASAVILILATLSLPSLLAAWRHAPFDQWGWLAGILWFSPLLFRKFSSRPLVRLHFGAMGLAICGLVLGELRVCYYLAFALATASLLPWNRFTLAWLATSLSWMPLLGLIASELGSTTTLVVYLRLLLALTGVALLLPSRLSHRQLVPKNA